MDHWLRILIPAALAVGCAGSADISRATLDRSARALVTADRLFAPVYQAARVEARESSETRGERDEKIAPFERVRDSLHATQSTLYAAEAALDARQGAEDGAWLAAAACVADALAELRAAFRAVGLEPPPGLSKLDAALRSLTRASCRPGAP